MVSRRLSVIIYGLRIFVTVVLIVISSLVIGTILHEQIHVWNNPDTYSVCYLGYERSEGSDYVSRGWTQSWPRQNFDEGLPYTVMFLVAAILTVGLTVFLLPGYRFPSLESEKG
jgi:hypothetical protein